MNNILTDKIIEELQRKIDEYIKSYEPFPETYEPVGEDE